MKPLILTDAQKEKLRADFDKFLETAKLKGDKVVFEKSVATTATAVEVKVNFTELAWRKLRKLVDGFETEVGWHGTVNRISDHVFQVDDIIVFPQKVTGMNVDPDEAEYTKWIMSQPDEVFNRIRFHGHSHVNMSVSPSSTDDTYQYDILSQLSGEDFYIFLITNKDGVVFCRIYDLKTNAIYDNKDVTVTYIPDEIDDWFDENSKLVTTQKTYSYYGGRTGGYNYVSSEKSKKGNTYNNPYYKDDIDEDDDDYWYNMYKQGEYYGLE